MESTATNPTIKAVALFEAVKMLSKHDKAIFCKYLVNQFKADEIVHIVMDDKLDLNKIH